MNLYRSVKKISTERGVTIMKLEKDCGLASGSVCRWNDVIPSVKKAKIVADYLGVTVDELISEEEKVEA